MQNRNNHLRLIASSGLVIGAVCGVAGTFVPAAPLRGLLWGLDGVALIVAGSLLTIHHLRRENEVLAAGFLVFIAGESLILAAAAMDIVASAPLFAAGVSLWAASLILVSSSNVMSAWIRGAEFIAGLLFTVVAVKIWAGHPLTALSQPLPFFAYPFFAATLIGWAWVHHRDIA